MTTTGDQRATRDTDACAASGTSAPIRVIYDISVLGTDFRTGVFRAAYGLARALVRSKGCEVKFAATQNPFVLLTQSDVVEHDPVLAERIHPEIPRFWRALRRADKLARRLTRPVDQQGLLWGSLRQVKRVLTRVLRPYFRTINAAEIAKAQIFHTPHYPHPDIVRRDRHIKRFITVHDVIPLLHPEFFEERLVNSSRDWFSRLDQSDWVVASSRFTKEKICEVCDVDPCKVAVAHLGADESLFYPVSGDVPKAREVFGIPDEPYLLAVATFEPRKNLDHVLRCFARLVQGEKLDANLVLVGTKGWKYDRILKAMDDSVSIRNRIFVTGYVRDEYLAGLYSGASVFVYPSLIEGFGLPVLEAMQCGCPIISSTTSSLPEVVGDAGILVNPSDEDALCQAILSVVGDPARQRTLSQMSLAQARCFSWDACAEATIAAYRVAIGA